MARQSVTEYPVISRRQKRERVDQGYHLIQCTKPSDTNPLEVKVPVPITALAWLQF
jgi:hypothetical protein